MSADANTERTFEVGDRVRVRRRGAPDFYAGMEGRVEVVATRSWAGLFVTNCSVRFRPDLLLPFAFSELEPC